MLVTTGMLITFTILVCAMLSLWLGDHGRLPLGVPLWTVLLTIAFATGLYFDFVEPIAAVPLAALAGAAKLHGDRGRTTTVRVLSGLAVLGLAIALSIHAAPGFNNPKLFARIIISPDGQPYTRYLNFDKSLVGLFIVAFLHQRAASRRDWAQMFSKVLAIGAPTVLLSILLSLHFGYVRLDPKLHPYFAVWALTNLLFTCMAEEALFRGFIQKNMTDAFSGFKYADLLGLVCAAVLFGLLHMAGGAKYVVLSTIAGLGYGAVYSLSGRIEAPILTHFFLNVCHFLLFTYPALAA